MNDLFDIIMPIIGVIVGAFASYFAQKNLYKKQVQEERLRQRNQFIIEKLEVYSRILKASYDNVMISEIGGGRIEFNLEKYRNVFRPLFYEKLYLLDHEVINNVKKIDDYLIEADFYETPEYLDYDLMNNLFVDSLDIINNEMYNAREKILNEN